MPAVQFHKEIVFIPAPKVVPNSFNSNEVTSEEQSLIEEDIRENGFIGAILVRRKGEQFEIVDGEHRYRALVNLGVDEIPCYVTEQSDDQAMINCIRLNTERGNQNPKKVGAIVKTLSESGRYTLSDVSQKLIYSQPELQDRLDLLQLPENVEELVREREKKEQDSMFLIFSFMVPGEYKADVESAIESFGESKGKFLGEICRTMIRQSREERLSA